MLSICALCFRIVDTHCSSSALEYQVSWWWEHEPVLGLAFFILLSSAQSSPCLPICVGLDLSHYLLSPCQWLQKEGGFDREANHCWLWWSCKVSEEVTFEPHLLMWVFTWEMIIHRKVGKNRGKVLHVFRSIQSVLVEVADLWDTAQKNNIRQPITIGYRKEQMQFIMLPLLLR